MAASKLSSKTSRAVAWAFPNANVLGGTPKMRGRPARSSKNIVSSRMALASFRFTSARRFRNFMPPVFATGLKMNDAVRHDWTRAEIRAIHDSPLLDLVYRAATVHRQHHDAREM